MIISNGGPLTITSNEEAAKMTIREIERVLKPAGEARVWRARMRIFSEKFEQTEPEFKRIDEIRKIRPKELMPDDAQQLAHYDHYLITESTDFVKKNTGLEVDLVHNGRDARYYPLDNCFWVMKKVK